MAWGCRVAPPPAVGGPLCPHLFSKLAQQVQTWLKPPWAGASGRGTLAALAQCWSRQLQARGGCGHPNRHVLSVELTDMRMLVADLAGKGGAVLPRAWHRTMSRVNLPFSRCEVLSGAARCMAWVGLRQTRSVCGRYLGILPKALNPVFQVAVEVGLL